VLVLVCVLEDDLRNLDKGVMQLRVLRLHLAAVTDGLDPVLILMKKKDDSTVGISISI
jgi:hypothetical protein